MIIGYGIRHRPTGLMVDFKESGGADDCWDGSFSLQTTKGSVCLLAVFTSERMAAEAIDPENQKFNWGGRWEHPEVAYVGAGDLEVVPVSVVIG